MRQIEYEKMKKEVILKASTITLALLLLFSGIAAAQSSSVILVSDNEADSAIANLIAGYLGFEVITTPWGEFNQSIVDEIRALNPENIYILGGDVAVVGNYDKALNFTNVTRIAGETREITAAKAMKHFKNKLKGKKIIMVYGYDSDAIRKAFERAKREKAVVAFIKPDDVPEELKEAINETNASDVEIDESPNIVKVKIEIEIKEVGRKFKIKELNQSEREEKAREQIEEARKKITEAENKTRELNITNEELLLLLNNSKKHLQKALEAYNNSKYGEAFGQAIAAEHIAENVKKIAERVEEGKENKEDLMHEISEIEHELMEELEEKTKEAEKEGMKINRTRMQIAMQMIKEAREAMESGNIATAMMKMMEARKHKAMVKIEIEREKEEHMKKAKIKIGIEQEKKLKRDKEHEEDMKHSRDMMNESRDMSMEGMGEGM